MRRLVIARRSYERPFPKSKKQRVVAMPEEFVPFIAYAPGDEGPWLFPDETGAMRNKTWQPEDVLRRAQARGRRDPLHARLPAEDVPVQRGPGR